MLWRIDMLLGGDREIGDCTATVHRHPKKRRMVFSARSSKQQLNSNREIVSSVLSVQRYYKQDELVEWMPMWRRLV
jgi:hypothetical protein